MRKAFLALLLSATCLWAADPPKVPAEVIGNAGQLVTLTAETPNPVVKFKVISGDGLTVIPTSALVDKKSFLAVGKAGRYRVICWTADKDGPSDAVETLLIVKGGDDVKPIDVDPTDPVYGKLKTAYGNEAATDKADKAKKLANSYREVAASLAKGEPMTAGDVFRTAVSKRTAAVGDAMSLVRSVAGDSIADLLGDNPDTLITKSQRDSAIKQYGNLADYLERIIK